MVARHAGQSLSGLARRKALSRALPLPALLVTTTRHLQVEDALVLFRSAGCVSRKTLSLVLNSLRSRLSQLQTATFDDKSNVGRHCQTVLVTIWLMNFVENIRYDLWGQVNSVWWTSDVYSQMVFDSIGRGSRWCHRCWPNGFFSEPDTDRRWRAQRKAQAPIWDRQQRVEPGGAIP